MSEEQKSAMGPRRLIILLALGAVVFYFLSAPSPEKDKVDDLENNIEIVDENPSDLDIGYEIEIVESGLPTESNSYNKSGGNKKEKSTKDSGYAPQSRGGNDGYNPQSRGGNDGYNPQSIK